MLKSKTQCMLQNSRIWHHICCKINITSSVSEGCDRNEMTILIKIIQVDVLKLSHFGAY